MVETSKVGMAESLKEFRDRHPTASICSDVLQVHNEQFVVQVTVEVPELGRATGLSSHADIEVAEDRARTRALQALGWGQGNPTRTAEPTALLPNVAPLPPATVAPEDIEAVEEPEMIAAPRPLPPAASVPDLPAGSAIPATEAPTPKPSPPVAKPRSPVPSSKNGSESTATVKAPVAVTATISPQPAPQPMPQSESPPANAPDVAAAGLIDAPTEPIDLAVLPAPINLSDVIAQTDIELRRLGWSVETGRDYLEKTYDKRSRHELSEEELIQFLCHLESLSESPPSADFGGRLP
ncbi:MAG: hypothetical protein ACFB12_22285 [Leptolyngbyaceae cyanobacterium]